MRAGSHQNAPMRDSARMAWLPDLPPLGTGTPDGGAAPGPLDGRVQPAGHNRHAALPRRTAGEACKHHAIRQPDCSSHAQDSNSCCTTPGAGCGPSCCLCFAHLAGWQLHRWQWAPPLATPRGPALLETTSDGPTWCRAGGNDHAAHAPPRREQDNRLGARTSTTGAAAMFLFHHVTL